MGIYYSAAVVVGLPYDDIEDTDKVDQLVDDGDLDAQTPYYDGWDSRIIGFTVHSSGDYQASEIEWDQEAVEARKKEFRELVGQEPQVLLMPVGW